MRFMRDRLIRGAVAGVVGAVLALGVSAPSYFLLHFERQYWVESVFGLVLGHEIRSLPEWLFAYFLYFLWAGWIGALFVLLTLPQPGRGDYYLRALGHAFIGWLVTYMLGTLYRVPMLQVVAWQTGVSNILTLTVWGFVLGMLTKRWDRRYAQADHPRRVKAVRRGGAPWVVMMEPALTGEAAEAAKPRREIRLVTPSRRKRPARKRVRLIEK